MKSLIIAIVFAVVAAQGARGQLARAIELNDRGNQAADQGRYEEAIGLYRDALDVWHAAGSAYNGHCAGTLLNLAIVLSYTGNRPDAVRAMEESLSLHLKVLGPQHQRTVTNMNLLAANLLLIGRMDESEALFRESLATTAELYPDDIQRARALEGMSNILMRRGRASEALPAAEQGLALAIKSMGENSLDAALAYANVGEVHRAQNHPERALPLLRKARSLYERVLGPDHQRVAALMSQEGLLLLEDGKLTLADQLMTKALEALDRSCPKCAVEKAIAENNLAVLRFKQKRYREADDLLAQCVALRESYTAKPGEELAGTLRLLATVRQKEKLFDDAERLTRRANVIMGYR